MKERLFTLILAAIMALTLCACGNNGASGPDPAPNDPPASSPNASSSDDLIGPDAIDPVTGVEQSENAPGSINQNPGTSSDAGSQQPDETSAPEPTSPEGLIIMTIQTTTGAPNNLTISSINLDTGAMQTVSKKLYS